MKKEILEMCSRVASGKEKITLDLVPECSSIDCKECPFSSHNNSGAACGTKGIDYKAIASKYISKIRSGISVKKFKDIVNEIQKDEIWENDNFILNLGNNNDIEIRHKEGFEDCYKIYIGKDETFTLKNKEVNFNQAFESYKNGETIKSLVSHEVYKLIDGEGFCILTDKAIRNSVFGICEIDGMWNIID